MSKNRMSDRIYKSASHCLNHMFWSSGSHGIYSPEMKVNPHERFTQVERKQIKNVVTTSLINNEVHWDMVLVAKFTSETHNIYIPIHFDMPEFTLLELGTFFKECCEYAIASTLLLEEHQELSEEMLAGYAYILSPTYGLEPTIIEESIINGMESPEFGEYEWVNRRDISPKDFIDSIAQVKL